MIEIFLLEIDCDAKNGETVHSGFWRVMYSARIHRRIISEVLSPDSFLRTGTSALSRRDEQYPQLKDQCR